MLIKKTPWLIRTKSYLKQINRFIKGKITIHFMVVSVGQACSLKCKNCANLTPYCGSENKRYNVEDIIRHIGKISNVANITSLQIQGGEPFIYSDLSKLIEAVPDATDIRIATNGTIIPDKEVLEILKKRNVEVRISDYKIEKYKETVKKLQEELKKWDVKFFMYEFTNQTGDWTDMGGVSVPRKDTKTASDTYWTCSFGKNCLTLENGMLGYCSRAIIAPVVQGYDYNKKDYFYVDKIDKCFKLKLMRYIQERHPMEVCRYCYGMQGKHIKPAIQLDN